MLKCDPCRAKNVEQRILKRAEIDAEKRSQDAELEDRKLESGLQA
jgi:hypothetical protein